MFVHLAAVVGSMPARAHSQVCLNEIDSTVEKIAILTLNKAILTQKHIIFDQKEKS
jgi:hypothetical protein